MQPRSTPRQCLDIRVQLPLLSSQDSFRYLKGGYRWPRELLRCLNRSSAISTWPWAGCSRSERMSWIRQPLLQLPATWTMTMSPQTRPDMVELTFEVPDRLLGQFYIAVGAVLKRGHVQRTTPQAEPALHDWGAEAID